MTSWADAIIEAWATSPKHSTSMEEVMKKMSKMDWAAGDSDLLKAFGVETQAASPAEWGLTDGPDPGTMGWFDPPPIKYVQTLMASGAGFEMVRMDEVRYILDHNVKSASGKPKIVHVFAPGHGAEAQTAWNAIHGPIAAETAAKKKAYVSGMAKKKVKTNHAMVLDLGKHIPDFYAKVKCPRCKGMGAPHESVFMMVQHLNDVHKWQRERIADWLETLDLDLTVHAETVVAEPPKDILTVHTEAPKGILGEVKDEVADIPDDIAEMMESAMAMLADSLSGFMASLTTAVDNLNTLLGKLQEFDTTNKKEKDDA